MNMQHTPTGQFAPVWTPENKQRLEALWTIGHSSPEIAALMGMTKRAVIGAARRMKLPFRQPQQRKEARAAKPKPEPYVIPPLEMKPTPLLHAGRGQCRWLLSEGPEFIVCGGDARGSFCPTHRTIAYPPRKLREAAE